MIKPTMGMIEAGAQAMMPIQEKSAFPNNLDLSRAAITAALAAMPAPEVKVKTLEWEQNEGDDWCFTQYTSDTFGGSYCIEERPTGDFDLHIPGAAVSERFSSLAEAKSAAQADYEARIRAALTPAPDLAAENERLRAALEKIADTDPDDGTIWFHNVANIALELKP